MQSTNSALAEEPSSTDSAQNSAAPPPTDLVPLVPSAIELAATVEETEDHRLTQVGGGSGIPFNGNQIKTAVSKLPPEQASQIVWLYEHGRDKNYNLETLGGKLRQQKGRKGTYNANTLYSVFRGRYNGALDNVVESIIEYRKLAEARESITRPGFITTGLTRQVFGVCERARSYQRVALLFGDGQIGKSESLLEYARINKSYTRYLRLPSEAPLRLVVQLLGRECYLSAHRSSTINQRAQIVEHFDSQMLLIIDELQQITLTRRHQDRLATVEFLREIFDRSGCGMVLCGTNEAMQEIETGPNSLWLRQLRRRSLPKITLPNIASDEDILAFAAHFGLGEEMPEQAIIETRRIAHHDGVGLLITYFQGAARMATAENAAADWSHFLRTVDAFDAEGKKRREGGR